MDGGWHTTITPTPPVSTCCAQLHRKKQPKGMPKLTQTGRKRSRSIKCKPRHAAHARDAWTHRGGCEKYHRNDERHDADATTTGGRHGGLDLAALAGVWMKRVQNGVK